VKRAALALGLVMVAGVARAQPAHLHGDELPGAGLEAEPPTIDVLTFGVGDRIFEKFGHAALCLRYHEPAHPSVCFNYGVTDFAAGSDMVWDFLRGVQRFWVEPTSLHSMLAFYEAEDRDIWRQTLPASAVDARAIEAALWANLADDKRFYNYDHFFDNCTTRLRDIIDDASHGALAARTQARYPRTFREIGRPGLAGMPLLLVASDLVAGRTIDAYPTVWQAMFHPAIFRQQLELQLGVKPEPLYTRRGPPFPTTGSTGRAGLLAVGLAFALPLLVAQWRRRWQRVALAAVTLELVVLGALIWSLVIVSSIAAVRWNEAVLVVTPLDLLLLTAWRRRYALARLGVLVAVSLLAAVGVLHQPLAVLIAVAFVPMLIVALDLPHGLAARASATLPAVAPSPAASPAPAGSPAPAVAPVAPTAAPSPAVSPAVPAAPSPAVASVVPAVAPSVPAVAPSVPAVAPSVPAVAPSVPAVAPSLPAVAPSLPAVAPSVPAVAPSVPAAAPSVPAVAMPSLVGSSSPVLEVAPAASVDEPAVRPVPASASVSASASADGAELN
jgi:hypothetical protein